MRPLRFFAVAIIVFSLTVFSFTGAASAQSTNASLAGRVNDPSRAVIADARVAAISAATNLRYETATNGSGEYHLANLVPGAYRIEVEKSGFKKLIRTEVILHVQDALEINFDMTLGDISEAITVTGGAPLVNSESGTVSTVIDRTFVENLPMNGRSFQTLIMLTPGVVVTRTTFNDQGQFSVNGQRADANYFTIDGVSANFGLRDYCKWCRRRAAPYPRSAPPAAPTASCRWTPCRSFAFKPLRLRPSSDAHLEVRYRS